MQRLLSCDAAKLRGTVKTLANYSNSPNFFANYIALPMVLHVIISCSYINAIGRLLGLPLLTL